MLRNTIERARLALRSDRAADARELLLTALGPMSTAPQTRTPLLALIMLAEAQIYSNDVEGAAHSALLARTAIQMLGLAQAFLRDSARLDIVDGKVSLARADLSGAMESLQRALATRQSLLHASSPLIALAELELANARKLAGDEKQAARLVQDARQVLAQHPHVPLQIAKLSASL
jgi:hypothetical protein